MEHKTRMDAGYSALSPVRPERVWREMSLPYISLVCNQYGQYKSTVFFVWLVVSAKSNTTDYVSK